MRREYFYLMARTCYDLSDFNRDDFYSTRYNVRGNAYMDSAIALFPSNSSQYLLMNGLKYLHLRDVVSAQMSFETMIKNFKLTDSEFAVAASTLSFIYFYNHQPVKSKEMLIRAAIADTRSCTKETLATLNLADMLYKEGDVENAYRYVKIALEDANFYGARHRKVQVAAVFPIIEGQQLSMVESRRKMLLWYSSIITVLSLLTIAFAIIIYKQFKNLREAKRVISQANDILTETNHQLGDANKIKEEYIWYYFNTTADYINKLDSLKKSMDLKLMTKKIDELRFSVDSINIKKEREDLYHNFDMVFLKLFPDFVTVFNSFFKEEDRLILKDNQLLNTELRIFALIRMGIHDNEKIAKILDYSVTTIYTYKTRIRSKSLLPNEEFDKRIMAIRAI
jgi:tetratricopeptide (TPR) repeat protein